MNFRKVRVSKAALLVPLSWGLLVPAPSPPPPMEFPAPPGPAALVYADPPPLAAALTLGARADQAHATGTCANAKHEARFEMLSVDADPYPPTWRHPAVCLAVYIPDDR